MRHLLLIGILVAFSPVAWAQVATDTTWEDDLDALEHEMLRDLLSLRAMEQGGGAVVGQ